MYLVTWSFLRNQEFLVRRRVGREAQGSEGRGPGWRNREEKIRGNSEAAGPLGPATRRAQGFLRPNGLPSQACVPSPAVPLTTRPPQPGTRPLLSPLLRQYVSREGGAPSLLYCPPENRRVNNWEEFTPRRSTAPHGSTALRGSPFAVVAIRLRTNLIRNCF